MESDAFQVAREATWAAQSAADAAWWGLLTNSIASVATLGALVATIVLATQAGRQDAARKKVLLGAAKLLIRGPHNVGQTFLDKIATGQAPAEAAKTGLMVMDDLQLLEQMHLFDVADLPTPKHVANFMSARIAAKHIHRDLHQMSDGHEVSMPLFEKKVANLAQWCEDFG